MSKVNASTSTNAGLTSKLNASTSTSSNSGSGSGSGSLASQNMILTQQTGTIVLIVFAVIILVVIIVYITSMILKSSKERTAIATKPVRLDGSVLTIPGRDIVSTKNGQEFTYSFWMFLSDDYSTTGGYKRVFVRGDKEDLTNCNPIVYMHPTANKMTFVLNTNKSLAASPAPSTLSLLNAQIRGNNSQSPLNVTVDYVPMQRWIHFAMAFQDGILTIYMDGTVYQVKSLYDMKDTDDTYPIAKGTTGDISIGDSANNTKGFLARIEFYNYFLPQKDVMGLYQRGPNGSGFLSSLFGLDDYGFRNPFYRKTTMDTAN